ncbi:MAG TPA: hypothetical protein VH305_09045 [Gaiella sp.]|jgi:hypothetical protein
MRWAAVVLAAAVAAVMPVPGPATAAPGEMACSYEDPDFGIHTHSLDVDTVSVAHSKNNRVTFTVAFPTEIELASDTGFQIAVDRDFDPGTGDEDGFDLFIGYVQDVPEPNPWLSEWRSGDWTPRAASSLAFSHERDHVVFQLDEDELPDAFRFQVAAGTGFGSADADVDFAPEREHVLAASERGVWSFPACETIGAEAADSGGGWGMPLVLTVVGLGAVVAIAGWTLEKLRGRRG